MSFMAVGWGQRRRSCLRSHARLASGIGGAPQEIRLGELREGQGEIEPGTLGYEVAAQRILALFENGVQT
jgi:hypothetical protein